MTTKDNFLFSKDIHEFDKTDKNGKYLNLNLNQKNKCSSLILVQSNSKSYSDKKCDSTVLEKSESPRMKKSSVTDLCSNVSNSLSLKDENEESKKKKNISSNDTNNSTLSLHISAYENSNESTFTSLDKKDDKTIDTFKNLNKIGFGSTSIISNTFDFPRQQESHVTAPEVSQFRASQRLLVPGQSNTMLETAKETSPRNASPKEAITSDDELVREKMVFKGQHGTYKVEKELGRGQYGGVYLVRSMEDNSKAYAMKAVVDEENIKMEREALEKAASTNSIHLCKMVDYGEDNQYFFVIIDLLGTNLKKFKSGKSEKVILKIAEQCLIAIEAMHTLGILHRDIKAENYVMGQKGTELEFCIRLIDLGSCIENGKVPETFGGTDLYASIAAMENKVLGFKDDIESWIYMLVEWLKNSIPWKNQSFGNILKIKKELRDDSLPVFKEFFGEFEPSTSKQNIYVEMAKILRYIDSLKPEDVPDYDRIHYFLQSAFTKLCDNNDKENDEYLQKFQMFSRGVVPTPANLTFFSSIDYSNKNRYRHIEFKGSSLNFSTGDCAKCADLTFKCCWCIDRKPCGLKVRVKCTGNEKLWDAAVYKVENEEKCKKLKTLNGSTEILSASDLKQGDQLGSWKIVSDIDLKGFFKVINVYKSETERFSLKAIKNVDIENEFENEKAVLLHLKSSTMDKLCELYDDGKCRGFSFFVLTHIGSTLEQLRINTNDQKLSMATTFSVGIQCIEALEQLHSLGFIHNNVTPEAFAIRAGDPHRVCLYEFKDAVKLVSSKEDVDESQTPNDQYKPLSYILPSETGPNGDMESVLYVLIKCLDGKLPWEQIQDKRVAAGVRFNVKAPKEITALLNIARFSPSIDYTLFKTTLSESLKQRELGQQKYEWEQ